MTQDKPDGQDDHSDDFASQAEEAPTGIVREFWYFLRYNKKWWLLPILIVLCGVGACALLAGSPIAPFIYTLW